MYPVEIWENILHRMDANSLLHLRSVSTTWNAIITKHLEKSDAWYRQCEKDIPQDHWHLLLENSFYAFQLARQLKDNKEFDRFDSKTWITLCKAYWKWRNVHLYSNYIVLVFNPIPKHRLLERITCCSTLGELVAVGSSEGYIRVYNLKTKKEIFHVDQFEYTTSVKLWVQGKNHDKIILIATSQSKKIRVWDIVEKSLLRSRRTCFAMCTGPSYYCVGLQKGIILVYNLESGVIFCLTLVAHVSDIFMLESLSDDSYPVNMTLNMDQLSCLYNDNFLYEIDLKEAREETALYHPEISYLGAPRCQNIISHYLFNPLVAFCTTDRGQLGVSVNRRSWKFLNTYSIFEGLITTIHFHVSVLAIGLDYGCVYLYYVKDPRSLRKINFKKGKKIQISQEFIASINLMELSGDQRLIVTTRNSVYNIKLEFQ